MDIFSDWEPIPRQAIVFYETFIEAIETAPEKHQKRILWNLIECGLGRQGLNVVPYPDNVIIRPMLTNMDYAERRYYAAHRDGEKGGRPKLKIDLEDAQNLYRQYQSWETVAKKLGISEATLYRERKAAGLI